MDLPLYTRILWRHRRALLASSLIAIFLAVLAYYRVDVDGVVPKLTPRKAEVWQSEAQVILTEGGFAAGSRAQFPNAGRFSGLSTLYARLAESDEVLALIETEEKLPGLFQAAPITDNVAGPLPIVALLGKGDTASAAEITLSRGMKGFFKYVGQKQVEADIPPRQRIRLEVLNAPDSATLIQPRKKTLPVVVFLAVMIAAIAIIFTLENAARRPGASPAAALPLPDQESHAEPAPIRAPAFEPIPQPVLGSELRSARDGRATPEPRAAPEVGRDPEREVPPPDDEQERVTVRRWA